MKTKLYKLYPLINGLKSLPASHGYRIKYSTASWVLILQKANWFNSYCPIWYPEPAGVSPKNISKRKP